MCKSKMDTNAIPPSPLPSPSSSRRHRTTTTSASTITTTNTTTASTSSLSSRNSLSSLRSSLPENPHLYNISEIRSSTNNFLSKSLSTSSSSSRSWRCNLHGKDVIIFQRKSHLHQRSQAIRQKLSSISKSHHSAIVNLLGASISGDYIYLVYDFINGASLYDLLHNRNNPNFTVLNTWISRMQIATDLAHGLDYIHNNTGLDVTFVHNHIKSSSVIVTEPSLNAKICHFGAAELCNEPVEDRDPDQFSTNRNKIEEEEIEIIKENQMKTSKSPKFLDRSNSIKFNGTRGYMSPEFQSTGIGTRKSDVYAFGVVLLELISGEEPVKYKYDKEKKEYKKIAAMETAVGVVESGGEEREGRLRKWVDRRLKDSFPVDVAEKMTRLAVDCVHVDPNQRPDMRRVAGKISRLYLESQAWCERVNMPTDITVSFAPR